MKLHIGSDKKETAIVGQYSIPNIYILKTPMARRATKILLSAAYCLNAPVVQIKVV